MKVAFIGLGLMGTPMAKRLLTHKYEIAVFNRTREKTKPLADAGAKIASSAAEAVADSDCIILMLSDYKAVCDIVADEKVCVALKGKTIIQMGTISPSQSRKLKTRAENAGAEYFESPVLGSIAQVNDGSLILMVGGTARQFEKFKSLLECFGPEPVFVGEVGKAAALKLALNQLIASLMAAFSLSFGYILREEIPPDMFMKVLRRSALHAKMFDGKLQRLVDEDFTNPNFTTKHLAKDVNLLLDELARHKKIDPSVLIAIAKIVDASIEAGEANSDYSSIYKSIDSKK